MTTQLQSLKLNNWLETLTQIVNQQSWDNVARLSDHVDVAVFEYLCFQLNVEAHGFLFKQVSTLNNERHSQMLITKAVLRVLSALLDKESDKELFEDDFGREMIAENKLEGMLEKFEELFGTIQHAEFHYIYEMILMEIQLHCCLSQLPQLDPEDEGSDMKVSKEEWNAFNEFVNKWFPPTLLDNDVSVDDLVATARCKIAADLQETVFTGYDDEAGIIPYVDIDYLLTQHRDYELAFVLQRFGQVFHILSFGVPELLLERAQSNGIDVGVVNNGSTTDVKVTLKDVANVYEKLGGKLSFQTVRQGTFGQTARHATSGITAQQENTDDGTTSTGASARKTTINEKANYNKTVSATKVKEPMIVLKKSDVHSTNKSKSQVMRRKRQDHASNPKPKTRMSQSSSEQTISQPGTRSANKQSSKSKQKSSPHQSSDSDQTVSDDELESPSAQFSLRDLETESKNLASQVARFGDPLSEIMAEDREILQNRAETDSEEDPPSVPNVPLKGKRKLNVPKENRSRVIFNSQLSSDSEDEDNVDQSSAQSPRRNKPRRVRLQPIQEKEISPLKRKRRKSTSSRRATVSPAKQTKKRHKFTEEEEEWVIEGVKEFGEGKWREILDKYPFHHTRTSVAIKDKYRNIIKKNERLGR